MVALAKTALVLMDFQRGIVDSLAQSGSGEAVKAARLALDAAREGAMPVIHVVVQFRPDYVDISERNKRLAGVRASGRLKETDAASSIVDELAPKAGEPVVVKRRFSALAYTDLSPLLRSLDIDHLVMAGLSTTGVILSTVRAGADEDYRMTVLSDACADPDLDLHRILLDKVLSTQADIVSAAEFARTARSRSQAD